MKLTAVLSDRYLAENIDNIPVCVLQIEDKKKISSLVARLSHLYPWTEEFSHLKRVRTVKDNDILKYQIILTKAEDVDRLRNEFKDQGEILIVKVPEICPLTRIQFENCKKFWPTNFHENKHISNSLQGNCFDEVSLARIDEYFKRLEKLCSEKKRSNAALAVNNNEVIELSTNDCDQPLKHAIFCLIDRVAKKHLESHSISFDKNGEQPYLLTGCDVFVTEEPCVMCTMALIHSRVKRLFFVENINEYNKLWNCPKDEAISSAKLHVNVKLNHHFEAWKVYLKN